jgi:signal transduction histidine kinase
MKLTPKARQMLVVAVIGQIIILFICAMIYKPLVQVEQLIWAGPKSKADLSRLLQVIKRDKSNTLSRLVERNKRPWLKLSLREQPSFPVQSLSKLKENIRSPLDLRPMRLSLNVGSKEYLNLEIVAPPSYFMFSLPKLGLLIGAMVAIFFLNFYVVRRINTPLQKLIENLELALENNQWQPIVVSEQDENMEIFTKINQLQQSYHKLIKDRTHMLEAISHDLRTPLTRIKLRAEDYEDTPQYPKLLQDISEMESMITETLNYFRDSDYDEAAQPFDLNIMLDALVDDLNITAKHIEFESDEQAIIVNGKFNLLKRAFNNVLRNAMLYGETAVIEVKEIQHSIEILIKDKGAGIAHDQLDKVFSPYYRVETSRSRKTGGSGLGLTIAKEIIQLHNGSLSLQNLAEGGLCVTIVLPKSN